MYNNLGRTHSGEQKNYIENYQRKNGKYVEHATINKTKKNESVIKNVQSGR